MQVEMLSHFGSEHYCPLSLLRVHGSSMMEELEDHEIDGQDDNDNSDSDQDVPVLPPEPGAKGEDEPKKPNFLERAADTVISLVKKITGNEHEKGNGSDKLEKGGEALDTDSNRGETSSEIESKSKHKIVTLVGHEELKENLLENKTINASDATIEQAPRDKGTADSQEQKTLSVNGSSEKTSICEEMESGSKSKTTSPALTPCQSFAQVIGQYCLGCVMGRLLFSKNRYQEFTFQGDVVNSRKTILSPVRKLKSEKKDESSENKEKDDQEEINKLEVQVTIQEKPSASESSVQQSTPSEEEIQQSSVNIPKPSSSNLEVTSEVIVSSPVHVAETVGASSRIVKPSHSVNIVEKKGEISEDKTPSLAKVSVVSAAPLNSADLSSSSVKLQSSELPVFKESERIDVREQPDVIKMQGIKETIVQESLSPTSQSSTLNSKSALSEQKNGFKRAPESVQSEVNNLSKNEEKREPDAPDKLSGGKDNEIRATPTECKAPNSLHTMPFSSPDIDVLETKLTDKEGREGTAQLPQEIGEEKDSLLPNEGGESQDNNKQVTDSQNVNVESEESKNKEPLPNLEQGSASSAESTTSTTVVEPQSVSPTVQPGTGPVGDTNDLLDPVLPLPAPPIASASSQEFASAASSDANLDVAMLSKAQQQVTGSSAGVASVVGSGGHKESIFVRLSNKIKALEQNLNVSTLYMEQLNQR